MIKSGRRPSTQASQTLPHVLFPKLHLVTDTGQSWVTWPLAARESGKVSIFKYVHLYFILYNMS